MEKNEKITDLLNFVRGAKAFTDHYDPKTRTLTYYDDRGQKQIIENISPEHVKMLTDLQHD